MFARGQHSRQAGVDPRTLTFAVSTSRPPAWRPSAATGSSRRPATPTRSGCPSVLITGVAVVADLIELARQASVAQAESGSRVTHAKSSERIGL